MTDLLVTILLCWKTTGDYKSLLENTGDNWRFCSNIPGIRSWCYSPNLLYYESLRSTKHAHIHTAQANTPKHPQTTPLTNTHHPPHTSSCRSTLAFSLISSFTTSPLPSSACTMRGGLLHRLSSHPHLLLSWPTSAQPLQWYTWTPTDNPTY